MLICKQFLSAHNKLFGVTVDCYLSTSTKCSAIAKKTLETKFAGVYSCVLDMHVVPASWVSRTSWSPSFRRSSIDLEIIGKSGIVMIKGLG